MNRRRELNIKINSYYHLVSIVFIFCLLQSCSFYKVKTAKLDKTSASSIISENLSYYYIVHVGDNMWQLSDMEINDNSISGSLAPVNEEVFEYYRKAYEEDNYKFHKKNMKYISQLHMHVDHFKKLDGRNSFKLTDINRIDVMHYNSSFSTFSKTLMWPLIALGSLIPVGVIASEAGQ